MSGNKVVMFLDISIDRKMLRFPYKGSEHFQYELFLL